MDRRVIITGYGAVSPLGNNAGDTWEAMKAGKNGISRITHFGLEDQKVTMGGEVRDFVYRDKKEGRRMDLFTQYGVMATAEALEMSGLASGENIDAKRLGVYAGSGIGGISTVESEVRKGIDKGLGRVSAVMVPMIIGNILAGNISILFQARGSSVDIVTACSCGTHSIGEAARAIRHGYLDAVIAGAAEAPFAPTCFAGFANMTAMSEAGDPDRASIPFDKERQGFIMGEGAGILILEELEHARARGAKILAEVAGYGSSSDAYHITMPAPDGTGAADSMEMAIQDAGIRPEAISYINAHGTGTPYNDLVETIAIKKVFGDSAYRIPVSSTKSMTGHMLGAAGAVEAVTCIKAIEEDIIPPTINLRVPDEELDLDYVPDEKRSRTVDYALSNSFGFGGHNATLILKKYTE